MFTDLNTTVFLPMTFINSKAGPVKSTSLPHNFQTVRHHFHIIRVATWHETCFQIPVKQSQVGMKIVSRFRSNKFAKAN
jgi:hypothetical protein